MIHRHLDRVFRRLSIASLIFLILVTLASAIFMYLVSPLREDPTFQRPHAAYSATTVEWLSGVNDDVWANAAVILAGLLALNSMLVLWTLQRVRQIGRLIILGLCMWFVLWYVYTWYLIGLVVVD